MRSPKVLPLALFVTTLTAAACQPASSASGTPSQTASSAPPSSTTTSAGAGVDPLVPYSPPPQEVGDKATGFAGDTLAASDSAGGTMYVTLVSTAIGPVVGPDGRPFSLWFTIKNAHGPVWSGFPGGFVTVTDDSGVVLQPIPTPRRNELHPHPGRYGGSNLDLHKSRTIGSGQTIRGVSLFRVQGGYRSVTVAISFDKGATWVSWQTSFGPS